MILLHKGDVVLAPFPFTDLSQSKQRPAVVLCSNESAQDVTLCFISSQNTSTLYTDEFVIDTSNPEFGNTGLKVTSKVRVSRIVTLERRLITRRLGQLGSLQMQQLNTKMIQVFQLS